MAQKVSLLDCPAEVRQQILRHLLPTDIHAAEANPRTAPLLPLLLTCKIIRLDVLEIIRVWSPVYHFSRPEATTSGRWRPDEPHMRTISLRLFSGIDLQNAHAGGALVRSAFVRDSWMQCLATLPRAAVKTVLVDITTVPSWLAARRPDWVHAALLDNRNRLYLSWSVDDVVKLVRALRATYSPEVAIRIGGQVTIRARAPVDEMVRRLGAAPRCADVDFVGTWVSGPRELPTRLSLALLCRCWAMELRGEVVTRCNDQRLTQIRNEARRTGLTTPDLDLRSLGPVSWSIKTATAYYVNALNDEKRTRGELLRMLGFAVELRAANPRDGAHIDFAPAVKERRGLLHRLARDLGLASESVGDAGESFVRVSHAAQLGPEAEAQAAAHEAEA